MNVLFDTNVVLDVLLEREPHVVAAAKLFALVDNRRIRGTICATTATTIFYIAAKRFGVHQAREQVRGLLSLFDVAPVDGDVLDSALDIAFSDYEDAVLHEAAKAVRADVIVTRDRADFARASIPTVYVMGTLSAIDSRCVKSNNTLVCQLGTINASKTTTVAFNIALPQADEVLQISAAATTTSSENSTSNNAALNNPTLLNYSTVIPGGSQVINRHCTGTNLTSYFECELFPSSISSHDTLLNGNGTVTIIDDPINYSGTWSQPTSTQLNFQYFENGDLVVDFEGFGSAPGCFEGIAIFPGSAYLSPYEVCL